MISSSAVVLVLVDEQDPERRMGLTLERFEQALQLVRAVDAWPRRDRMTEARCGPRPYANARAARLGPPGRPQRRPLSACRRRERAPAVARRPRADRRRRRVFRRDAGESSARSPTRGSRCSRNDEQLGLAASLNRGLDQASGRYVARLDSDDVALPGRLESPAREDRRGVRPSPSSAAASSISTAPDGPGRCTATRSGATAVRFLALFGAPFFHPTVLVDRELLDRQRPSLRPGLSRERGLRPLDAAARARRRRESRRGARPEARPSGAGVSAAQRRPGVLPAAGGVAGDRAPRARARAHGGRGGVAPGERPGSGRLGSGRPLPGPPRCLRAASRRRPRGTRGRGESAPARGCPPRARPRPLLSGTARRRSAQTATGRAGGEEARGLLARAARRLAAPAARHGRLPGTDARTARRSSIWSPRAPRSSSP